MLSAFRRHLDSWIVRGFFLLLVIAFSSWGVADVVRTIGVDTSIARVGSMRIEPQAAEAAYRRQLAQLTTMLGGRMEPTVAMRRAVAAQAVEQLVTQAAMNAETQRLGLRVPDAALRAATFAMPAFAGSKGQFDHAVFLGVLQRNGMDETQFAELMRADLADRQLLSAVRIGASVPAVELGEIFDFQGETRVALAVELPFAAAAPPPPPSEAQLNRFWANNPDLFSAPEYRRIKAVILSPETLARDIPVSAAELQAAYTQRRAEFVKPERRSFRMMLSTDAAHAKDLAALWRKPTPWAAMQQAASKLGASAVQIDDSTIEQIPVAELGKAVFAATPDQVLDPIKTDIGWYVMQVTKVVPPVDIPLDAVKDELRRQVAQQKAADLIYDRANKVEDALAGGGTLDELPNDLGLAALAGTLDAKGITPAGEPAPLPGSPALRAAILAAAFRLKPGQPPHLTEVPAPSQPGQPAQPSSYYALVVQSITPAKVEPFADVRKQVEARWQADAIRHEQETTAATLLAAVKAGQTLTAAAQAHGLQSRTLPAVGREGKVAGVPAQLVPILFGIKPGEPTMVETPEGFWVAVLSTIQEPDPKADPVGYARLRDGLLRGIGDDLEASFVAAVRARSHPRINRQMLQDLAQP